MPGESAAAPWRRWVIIGAAIAGVAVTASLGRWQLDRAAQKHALQAALDERGRLPVLELNSASLPDEAETGPLLYRRARIRGTWVAEHTVYLDNRQMNGRPGFFVVTPLQLDGRRQAVLVQRGWMARDPRDRTRVPDVAGAPGMVTVEGRIAPAPAKLYEFSAADAGRIRQNLDVKAFAAEIGWPLWSVSLLQTDTLHTQSAAGSAASGDGLLREWPRPALDIHKHYGYAFQWFGLCALMAGLYVWFQLVRPRFRRR